MACVALRLGLDVGLVVAPLIHPLTCAVSAPLMNSKFLCTQHPQMMFPLIKVLCTCHPRMMFSAMAVLWAVTTVLCMTVLLVMQRLVRMSLQALLFSIPTCC